MYCYKCGMYLAYGTTHYCYVQEPVGGFYCTGCGQHVSYGQPHTCSSQRNYSGTSWYPTIDNSILERIAKALERIADNLDERNK